MHGDQHIRRPDIGLWPLCEIESLWPAIALRYDCLHLNPLSRSVARPKDSDSTHSVRDLEPASWTLSGAALPLAAKIIRISGGLE
jgi:hypothetical protein